MLENQACIVLLRNKGNCYQLIQNVNIILNFPVWVHGIWILEPLGTHTKSHDHENLKALEKAKLSVGSLPLVLCNHVSTKGIFMGAIYLLIWILENPSKKSPNI